MSPGRERPPGATGGRDQPLARTADSTEGSSAPSVTTWADQIRPHLAGAVEHIVAAGAKLIEAKAALPHGQFGVLLAEIGLTRRTAQKFMRIAKHPLIANATPGSHLPSTWTVLFELSKVPAGILAQAIDSGRVTPQLTRAEAADLVGSSSLSTMLVDLEFLVGTMASALVEAEIIPMVETEVDPLFEVAAYHLKKLSDHLARIEQYEAASHDETTSLIQAYRLVTGAAGDAARRVTERRLRYQRAAGDLLHEMHRLVMSHPSGAPDRDEIASDLLAAAAGDPS